MSRILVTRLIESWLKGFSIPSRKSDEREKKEKELEKKLQKFLH